jgi:hypothetical protein
MTKLVAPEEPILACYPEPADHKVWPIAYNPVPSRQQVITICVWDENTVSL